MIDTDKLKQQAPSAAVGIVVGAAVMLLSSSSPRPSLAHLAPASQVPPGGEGVVTRLVSCGDSKQATVVGDDRGGTIMLGDGANGECTLLFGARWSQRVECQISNGTITAISPGELRIAGAGDGVAYVCGVPHE